MSKFNDLVRVCTRAVAVLMLAAAVAASVPAGNDTANQIANAPDAGVSSFSGYMVAVG